MRLPLSEVEHKLPLSEVEHNSANVGNKDDCNNEGGNDCNLVKHWSYCSDRATLLL